MVLENFRLQDKDNYKTNAIFLTLRIASAWTSVVLTGKKLGESHRYSTTGLSFGKEKVKWSFAGYLFF